MDVLHGGFVIYILNEVFYSGCVLEITCNRFGGKKKAKSLRCLLKGMNANICETAQFEKAVSQATPCGFLPHFKYTTNARNSKWLRRSIQRVFLHISISDVREGCVYRAGKSMSSFECSEIMLRYYIIPDILLPSFLWGPWSKGIVWVASCVCKKVPKMEYFRTLLFAQL